MITVADINLLQGTHSRHDFSTGNTLPLVAAPFGMTHWCTQTAEHNHGWFFHPDDRSCEGVRATHQPSPWIGDYGFFTLLPQTGPFEGNARRRAASYDRNDAVFAPHRLHLTFTRYQAALDLAPTTRCALLQLTFDGPQDVARRLVIALGRGLGEVTAESGELLGTARTNNGGVAAGATDFAMYFVARFDTPFVNWHFADGIAAAEWGSNTTGVTVRIGTSFISHEQARINLDRELGATATVEEIAARTEADWQAVLDGLQIKGGSERARGIFASCLWRTRLFPRTLAEPDATGGSFRHRSPYDGAIHDGPLVTDNGFWDTYRTVYPLFSLACPEALGEILAGWLAAYRESGWLPTWASPGHRTCMVGTHADAVFADAVVKGITGFDREEAWAGVRKDAFTTVEGDTGFGRLGLAEYLSQGYVHCDAYGYGVSRTLDYAYDDACASRVARAVGQDEDAATLASRAGNWKNVFDATESGMMRGKHPDGTWQEPFDPLSWGGQFVEGGAWQHVFGVPHAPHDLIAAMGGPAAFVETLEYLISQPPYFKAGTYPIEIHEMTEMAQQVGFGQYAHSNQPVHHILFLFACAGRPDLTQHHVRRVLTELYTPENFPGDEDNGEMAAWYVLSAMGIFPLCPGHPTYVLCSPLFEHLQLALPGGKTLDIRAQTLDGLAIEACPYTQSITRNGAPLSRLWISHEDLMQGGELVFTLGPNPAPAREYAPEDLPLWDTAGAWGTEK